MKNAFEFFAVMIIAIATVLLFGATVLAVFALRVVAWALLVGALGWLFSFLVDDALVKLGLNITPMQLGAIMGLISLVISPVKIETVRAPANR